MPNFLRRYTSRVGRLTLEWDLRVKGGVGTGIQVLEQSKGAVLEYNSRCWNGVGGCWNGVRIGKVVLEHEMSLGAPQARKILHIWSQITRFCTEIEVLE